MRRFLRNVAMYAFHLGFVIPIIRWVIGARYRRRGKVPEGPCLVVSNHNSHLDAALLMHLFPLGRLSRVHPVAAADYFGSNWFLRTMALLMMNGIPIERRPKAGEDALQPMIEALERGDSLIFFPEGSRGEAGVVAAFRPGVGRLVRKVPGLLVVPVFLSGPERIWPRGQAIPVPLAVDLNVGRPRTYPADLDARRIAERVREDVLALAPPPPPVPGPRPAPPVRIAICGIDNDRRVQVGRRVTESLGAELGPAVAVGEPMLEADADGARETAAPVPVLRSRAWLGLMARVFRTGGRFRGSRFGEMVERAAVDEALQYGGSTRFVVGGGNPLVDLLATARAGFYREVFGREDLGELMQYLAQERKIPGRRWWRFMWTAPEIWLINVFDLTRLLAPNVLVLLETDPADAMRRLRSVGRTLQPFENEEYLDRLQEGYREVAAALGKRRNTEVLTFGAEATDADEVARGVAAACRRLAERASAAVPGR